ncbi:ABC transporter permease subunit (plasmid) [Haloferacaceae archaeon DSL9]
MSVTVVSKKEVLDAVRSHALLAMTATFVLWAGFLAVVQHVPNIYQESGLSNETIALLNSMRMSAGPFVPLIGLALGYGAIVGERESGSLRLLLGLPHTRRDVVVGKFVGRTAVISIAILTSYATVAAIAALTYDSFALGPFVRYSLLTLLYGAVYVSIGIGFSAFMNSKMGALAGATVLYLVFVLFWDVFLLVLQLAFVGREPPESGLPEWIQFVGMLNPSNAIRYATRELVPAFNEITFLAETDALYLQNEVGFLVLALWIVVPLWVGYVRFERADLY